jgi:uncharacterized protein (DUF58 family)
MSGSMSYGSGEVKKADYAKMLASSLTYFAYHQRDAVGVMVFDEGIRSHIPSSRRTGQLHTLLHEIEKAVPEQGNGIQKATEFSGRNIKKARDCNFNFRFL